MKKLKISILAVLFTVGIGSAMVQKIHSAPKQTDPTYNWSQNGTNKFTGTVSDAQSNYGCSGTVNDCADGKLVPGQSGPATAAIFHN